MKSRSIYPKLFAALLTLCTTAILPAQPGENAKPEARQADTTHPKLVLFPKAKAGMERFVIMLPHKERGEEDGFKVELVPGKMMETDGVNFYSFGRILEEKNLEGFGYPYYEINEGVVKMTAIGADPKAPPVIKFVSGTPLHINYNSRLPIIIYAPAGYEVRYRIWKADEKFTTAPKG